MPALCLTGVLVLPLIAVFALALGWGAGQAGTSATSGTWAHLLDTGLAGDVTQVDLPGDRSGLVGLEKILGEIDGLASP